jgi:micrococcal nuclease
VQLELDAEPRDRYGRLLAYVWLGGEMLNRRLLAEGYAGPLRIAPNVRYAEEFEPLAGEAQAQERGLWGGCR